MSGLSNISIRKRLWFLTTFLIAIIIIILT